MRILRLFLYFIIGVLLSAVGTFSYAETIPATAVTAGWRVEGMTTGNVCRESKTAACAAMGFYWDAAYVNPYNPGMGAGYCRKAGSQSIYTPTACSGSFYTCPTGQNWTLSGSSCTRPDCDASTIRDPATGLCVNRCPVNQDLPGYYSVPWTRTMGSGGGYCIGGCRVYGPFGDVIKNGVIDAGGTMTGKFAYYGDLCSASDTEPVTPPAPKNEPPCAPGDGVIQYPDKTVKCVASGVPGATVPPVVKSDDKKTTYPDGSTSNTTVTQTCTGQGACSTTTITTITGVGGVPGGTAGEAGTPGTITGAGSSSVTGGEDQTSDFCSKNPASQICKGGMNEEATQKQVLGELKKLTDESGTAPGFSELQTEAAKPFGSEALTNADGKVSEYATGIKTDGPTDAKKSAWSEAMSSGWFTDVPESGCQPTDAKIGPFNWHFDMCPTAAKISEIGAYAMWFMLAVGSFVMVTGGRKE